MCASSDDLKSHRDPKLPLIPARQPPRRSGSCQRPLEQGPPEGRTYFVFIARRYRVPVTKDIKYSVGTLQKCYKSALRLRFSFLSGGRGSVGQTLTNSPGAAARFYSSDLPLFGTFCRLESLLVVATAFDTIPL